MEIADEIRAKYVFGEMTLKDFWPLVEDKVDLIYTAGDYNPDYFSNFRLEEKALCVYRDEHYDSCVLSVALDEKVKLNEDGTGIVFADEDGDEREISFFKARPVKVKILGSRKQRSG